MYGLGSESQNLPAFVVMSRRRDEVGPAGVRVGISAGGVPRHGIPRRHVSRAEPRALRRALRAKAQRATLDFINEQDQRHLEPRSYDSELEARIASYELAYRMQSSAPEAVDIGKESEATKKLYGIGQGITDDFGRKCLLARRLVERGVRFIQLYSGTNIGEDWDDAHTDLAASHTKMCEKTDLPIAGLLTDLKARGTARFDAGRLEQRVRPDPAGRGQERPRPSSVCVQHVDGGRGHQRRAGARVQRRVRPARAGIAVQRA